MKNLFIVIVAMLLVSALVYGQKQQLPTMSGGVQATRAAMLKGPHDFTPDSGAYTLEVIRNWDDTADSNVVHPHGPAKSLCAYCHAPHIPPEGIAAPLWTRASTIGKTFGPVYSNPISLDASVQEPGLTDNYSAFCLGCHDGSQLFVETAYAGGRPYAGTPAPDWTPYEGYTVRHEAKIAVGGEYPMDHVHPVNFDYNAAQALDVQGIYPALDNASYVWKGDNGSGVQTTVRLFNGYMQCSSCHNPHMNRGIGIVYTSDYGKLCVSCHKK
jgi:predicted CXXCH cytochrome family protein